MKRLVATIAMAVFIMPLASMGQDTDPDWNLDQGGSGRSTVKLLVPTAEGLFFAGTFSDSLVVSNEVSYSHGGTDVFVARASAEGALLWLHSLGGPDNDNAGGLVALGGTYYLGGTTADSLQFANSFNNPAGFIFLKQLDADGNTGWEMLLPFQGSATLDAVVAVDSLTLLATGMLRGCLEVNGQELCTGNRAAGYIMALSTSGQVLWMQHTQGSGNHRTVSVETGPGGELYTLTHATSGTYQPHGASELLEVEDYAVVLTRHDGQNPPPWTTIMSTGGFVEPINLATCIGGNVYVALNHNQPLTAGELIIETTSQQDGLLLQYTNQGELAAHVAFANPGYCRLMNIAVFNDDQVLATGYYHGQIQVLNQLIVDDQTEGSSTFLVQVFDMEEVVWVADIENQVFSHGSTIATDDEGNVFLSGGAFFGIRKKSGEMAERDAPTAFVTKYGGCGPLHATIELSGVLCPGDSLTLKATDGHRRYWWNGEQGTNTLSVHEPGEYLLTVADKRGCKASVLVEVAHAPATDVWLGADTVLMPGQAIRLGYDNLEGDFFWADGHPTPGRTVQYSKNVDSEQFTLAVKDDNRCWGMATVVVMHRHVALGADTDNDAGMAAYPVPFGNWLNWVFDNQKGLPYTVALYDSRGVVVYSKENSPANQMEAGKIDTGSLPKGAYVLRITTQKGVSARMVVKN